MKHALIVLFASTVGGAAAQEPIPFQLMDVFALEHASDPQISPDGDHVVYQQNFADIATDERYSNLWLITADDGESEALTKGEAKVSSPRWSPDGGRLAYISNAHLSEGEKGAGQIYVRDMSSGEVQVVSELPFQPSSLTWSPDGAQIAFTMHTPASPPVIGEMPEPPEGAKWKEGAHITDKLVYRFNRAGYLPYGYNHIYVIPSEGGEVRRISSGDYHHGGPGRRAGPLNWTPDGRSIVVSANRRDDADFEVLDTEVYAFRVRDGRIRQLTDRRGPDANARVSPDGNWIAYTGFDDERQGFQIRELYVKGMRRGAARSLTADLDRSIHTLRWAPDSQSIYVAYDSEGVTQLARVNLDGEIEVVADHLSGGSGYSAYGGGAQFSVAENGRFAAVYADPGRIEDIGVGDAERVFAPITNVNADLMAARQIGEVEEIWYESSVDGRKVQGWIVKPPNFDPSKKYPLILEIHGGPFANYGARFDFEKQLMAAAGYVVLYTNPRGSTSYGETFGNLIHHAYPGDDFYDLESGVDAVIERGYIDEDRLYVTGGSGGGVLTSWMIGRSDRFKAAVVYYPVIDWASFNLTTDIPGLVINYWFPGPPWEHPEHYFERSLLSVVNEVETPTLLVTGEADWRTPISQAEQYFAALKIRDVDTAMIRIPDEPHGIRVYPSHFAAKLTHLLAWFEKYP